MPSTSSAWCSPFFARVDAYKLDEEKRERVSPDE